MLNNIFYLMNKIQDEGYFSPSNGQMIKPAFGEIDTSYYTDIHKK